MPACSGVRLLLRWLQGLQAVTTFIQVSMPFWANGMMCSRVSSSSWKWPPQ